MIHERPKITQMLKTMFHVVQNCWKRNRKYQILYKNVQYCDERPKWHRKGTTATNSLTHSPRDLDYNPSIVDLIQLRLKEPLRSK